MLTSQNAGAWPHTSSVWSIHCFCPLSWRCPGTSSWWLDPSWTSQPQPAPVSWALLIFLKTAAPFIYSALPHPANKPQTSRAFYTCNRTPKHQDLSLMCSQPEGQTVLRDEFQMSDKVHSGFSFHVVGDFLLVCFHVMTKLLCRTLPVRERKLALWHFNFIMLHEEERNSFRPSQKNRLTSLTRDPLSKKTDSKSVLMSPENKKTEATCVSIRKKSHPAGWQLNITL